MYEIPLTHVEVSLNHPRSLLLEPAVLEEKILNFLCDTWTKNRALNEEKQNSISISDYIFEINADNNEELSKFINFLTLDDNYYNSVKPCKEKIKFHFYKSYNRDFEIETLDNNEDDIEALQNWILPNTQFHGLYETLEFDGKIKENILQFAESSLIFGQLNVNKNIIACNRLILLHGPPGTGKTSLSKAIAQKISIRQSHIYKFTYFIEINCHSLFSKWFSESGKLVQKLFIKIRELIQQPDALVCVLIDEIESIAYSRTDCTNEPKDAIRVVNALLTQLDQIKQYSNALILATSNLSSTIDLAFLDRIDLKQFIGFPDINAIFKIYESSLLELERVGLVKNFRKTANQNTNSECRKKLLDVAELSLQFNFSGRALRKIPFLAHVLLSNKYRCNSNCIEGVEFIVNGIKEAVIQYSTNEKTINGSKETTG